MKLKKGLLFAAGLAVTLACTPAFAHSRSHSHSESEWDSGNGWSGDGGFSAATLNGTYMFDASGFANHSGSGPGEVKILGTLTFDGSSVVTGNLILTAADGGQFSCPDLITTGGSYTVTASSTAPGLGTLILPVTGGVVNFNLLIPRSEGVSAEVIESDNGALASGISICGMTPSSMALKGHLKALPSGNWDN